MQTPHRNVQMSLLHRESTVALIVVSTNTPLSKFMPIKNKKQSCYLMRPFIPIISPKVLNLFPWWNVKCCRALYLHNFRQRALKQRPRCTEWAGNDLQFSSTWKQLMCLCKAVCMNVHQCFMCGIKIIECKLRLSMNSGCISLWYWVVWRFEKSFSPMHLQRQKCYKNRLQVWATCILCVFSVRAACRRWMLGLQRWSVCVYLFCICLFTSLPGLYLCSC